MADPTEKKTEKKRPSHRAFVTYKDEGFLAFLKKPSPKLPVVEVTKEGMQFRSIDPLDEGRGVLLMLRTQQHPKPARIKAQITAVHPETRIGEKTYAFRVEVKFVDISPEAWTNVHALAE